MRVAILTCVYPPYGGGIGMVAKAQARELAHEHEVTVFTPRYRGRAVPQRTPGVTVVALRPLVSFGNAAVLPQLGWRLRRYDIVHLHYPFFGAQEFLALLPRRLKLVVTFHMVPQASGVKGLVLRALSYPVERRLARRAQLLCTQTHDYLEHVAVPRLGQPHKWQVLPLGVDDHFTPRPTSPALRRELKLNEGGAVLVFVGTLDAAHAFKGVDVLLQAMTHLREFRVRLIVVGRGHWRSRYERLAQRLGLAQVVRFTGFVPDVELPSYLSLATAVVLPSTSEAETFGIVLLEAMACGVPVVTSRWPGVRELVAETGAGLLVTPGDPLALAAALEHLIASPAEARAMGERGRAAVEQHYRWSMHGQRLRELYHTYVV